MSAAHKTKRIAWTVFEVMVFPARGCAFRASSPKDRCLRSLPNEFQAEPLEHSAFTVSTKLMTYKLWGGDDQFSGERELFCKSSSQSSVANPGKTELWSKVRVYKPPKYRSTSSSILSSGVFRTMRTYPSWFSR